MAAIIIYDNVEMANRESNSKMAMAKYDESALAEGK